MIVFLLICLFVAVLWPKAVKALLGCLLSLVSLVLLWGLIVWGLVAWLDMDLQGAMIGSGVLMLLGAWETWDPNRRTYPQESEDEA